MARTISTFLMFTGDAEAAINLYVSLFAGSAVTSIQRRGPDEDAAEGTVSSAFVTLCGHELRFFDSPVKHAFTFTPSTSLFVECADEAELEAAYAKLSDGGTLLMPLDNYGFSRRFAWVNDRFGVSWQLNLA